MLYVHFKKIKMDSFEINKIIAAVLVTVLLIFGIGKIRSDILTVLDGKNLTADRTGNQIYGTLKIKDEYKKNNLILIPSGQFDFGHTILNGYQEAGTGAIIIEDQHVRTKTLRTTIAIVEDLSNDKYELKRHGK